jgi:hypothetical protein
MADATKNFAFSLVATAPSPATSGTSLVVTTGDGTLFPAAPFDLTMWPAGAQPTAANAEIARVTAVATDTFTITRAQYGTTAQSVATGWNVAQNITAAMLAQLLPISGVISTANYAQVTIPASNFVQVAASENPLYVVIGGTCYLVPANSVKGFVTSTGDTVIYIERGSASIPSSFTAATLPSSSNWHSVTYGNGKFVAVAYGSTTAAYSTDGINWTAATLPSSSNWESVTYGNGKFVAVAASTTAAAYSTDGINWTAATLPSSSYWVSVTYGNGKFVAVAYNSTAAAYSTDGINWTAATLPSSSYWYAVTYGNGTFVAIAYNSATAAYSTDGINWTAATLPSSTYWYAVTYGNGKFVAVVYGHTAAAYFAMTLTSPAQFVLLPVDITTSY